jgi:hypothetical protein
MSSNEEEAAAGPPQASEAAQANEAAQASEAAPASEAEAEETGPAAASQGERVGYGWPPIATRFRPGRSGNPSGLPKRARHLGAVVARALSERVAVPETDGRVRRLSKLEATVKQIVDGAAAGNAGATKLLFALIKADERALAEPKGRGRDERLSEADALVIAELRRRLTTYRPPGLKRLGARRSDES